MTVLEAVGCFLLALSTLTFLFGTMSGNRRVTYKQFDVLLFILFVAILILVYEFDPRPTIRFDIIEHYKTLDLMKEGGWDFAIHDGEYSNLLVTTVYFYIIQAIGNYRLLPLLPLVTEFLIFRFILFDQMHRRFPDRVPFADASFVVYTWFTTVGLMLAIVGVRCVWAVSIAVAGLYLDYVKKRRSAWVWLLYIVPVFIHSFALIVVVVRLLAMIPYRRTVTAAMVAGLLVGPMVLEKVFSVVGSGYLQYMVYLIMKYWEAMNILNWFFGVSNSTRTILICFVIVLGYLFYMLWQIKRCGDIGDPEDQRILNLGETAAYLSLVMLFNYLFLERYMYLICFVLVIIMTWYLRCRKKTLSNDLVNLFCGLVMLWLFFFHDIYIFLVNFTGVYFLAA